jgi:hypothetical protein
MVASSPARPIAGLNVTTLLIEHFGFSASNRELRAVRWAGESAADALAGRTVWCATAWTAGEEPARSLQRHLSSGGDLTVRRLELGADETLMGLGRSVGPILSGAASGEMRPRRLRQRLRDDGDRAGEALGGDDVRRDDVVVLHDAPSVALAQAVRERGAHAVWHLSSAAGDPATTAQVVASLLAPYAAAVDAYLVSWREADRYGQPAAGVAALMPCVGLVAAKRIGVAQPAEEPSGSWTRREAVGWSSALADVVNDDRHEHVGGMLHARPSVAPR